MAPTEHPQNAVIAWVFWGIYGVEGPKGSMQVYRIYFGPKQFPR